MRTTMQSHSEAIKDIHEKIKQNQQQPQQPQQPQQQYQSHQLDPIQSHEIRDPLGILELMRSRL